MYSSSGNCAASVPISTLMSCVCERFIYSQDRSTYLAAAKYTDRSWIYSNFSQIFECRNWEIEHYNSVLEIRMLTVSFLGMHTWKQYIYIGFLPALHLQCRWELLYQNEFFLLTEVYGYKHLVNTHIPWGSLAHRWWRWRCPRCCKSRWSGCSTPSKYFHLSVTND